MSARVISSRRGTAGRIQAGVADAPESPQPQELFDDEVASPLPAHRQSSPVAYPRRAVLLCAFAGALLISSAVAAAHVFSFSQFFTLNPSYDGRDAASIGILTVTAVLGFALVYHSMSIAASWSATEGRYRDSRRALLIRGAVVAMCVAGVCLELAYWDTLVAPCAVFFCVSGSHKYEPTTLGAGFLTFAGIGFNVILFGVALVQVAIVVRNHMASPSSSLRTGGRMLRNVSSLPAAVSVVMLAAMWMATMYMPNQWPAWQPAGVAEAARRDYNGCDDPSTFANVSYPGCPERLWATFTTQRIRLSETWVLKLFPGTSFVYVYFLCLLLGAALLRASSTGRSFLSTRIFVRWSASGRPTVGRVLAVCWSLVFLFLFTWYWVHDHNYDFAANLVDCGLPLSALLARAFGQVALALLCLLFVPVSRESLLHHVLGTSMEQILALHRAAGYAMLAATLGHMVLWYVVYWQDDVFPAMVVAIPTIVRGGPPAHELGHYSKSSINFTVPVVQYVTWVCFVTMGVLSYVTVRRKWFECFYYAHLVSVYAWVPIVLWHAAASWQHLLPGLALYVFDRLNRMFRSGRAVRVRSARAFAAAGVTELVFEQLGLNPQPGQYLFLCVPSISLFEWHPFTVARVERSSGNSATNDAETTKTTNPLVTVLCKVMPPQQATGGSGDTWTKRLFSIVANGTRGADLDVGQLLLLVDGPYGAPLLSSNPDVARLVFVTGGIGVTPALCAANVLREDSGKEWIQQRVTAETGKGELRTNHCGLPSCDVIWSVRDQALLTDLAHHVANLEPARLHLYWTGGGKTNGERTGSGDELHLALSSSMCAARIHRGRPNLKEQFCSLAHTSENCATDVQACVTAEINGGSVDSRPAADSGAECEMGSTRTALLSRGTHRSAVPQSTLVFACGPPELAKQAEDAASAMGWLYHAEVFEF